MGWMDVMRGWLKKEQSVEADYKAAGQLLHGGTEQTRNIEDPSAPTEDQLAREIDSD